MSPEEISQRFVQSYFNLYSMRRVRTKKQFCEAVGMFTSNLNQMSRGERIVTTAQICKLLNAYRINPMWLFYGIGNFID